MHNIFRYTPATYRALIEKGTNAAMMSMAQEKTPANDKLTEEFYSCFWEELKEPFVTSIRATKRKTEIDMRNL